jgi:hypothetical protein
MKFPKNWEAGKIRTYLLLEKPFNPSRHAGSPIRSGTGSIRHPVKAVSFLLNAMSESPYSIPFVIPEKTCPLEEGIGDPE